MPSTKCTATTKKGQPCRVWAISGTDPPRCFAHIDGRAHPSPPEEKSDPLPPLQPNPPCHNIDDLVRDMACKLAALSAFIDQHLAAPSDAVDLKLLCRLLTLYNQAAAKHARIILQANRHRPWGSSSPFNPPLDP